MSGNNLSQLIHILALASKLALSTMRLLCSLSSFQGLNLAPGMLMHTCSFSGSVHRDREWAHSLPHVTYSCYPHSLIHTLAQASWCIP